MINKSQISIVVSCICLCQASQLKAQDKTSGLITIHSDPRLAVLLKKGHIAAPVHPTRDIEAVLKATPAIAVQPQPVPVTHVQAEPAAGAPLPIIVHHDVKSVYKTRGFRVQIYSGPDRNKAMSIKTEFMRHFPAVHSYIIYTAPSFRVKIGDYRNRSDAEGMLREANSMFRPSMIVPDEVTISTF